ncbi:MAG: cytidylate kinase-like family protein [Chloroflexi bacterium]|nr:cytidylate kinase-like family protein [Chloroflexota bacterium]
MHFQIEYLTRDRIRTVAVTTDFNFKDVGVATNQLRSWAMIRNVPISGPPLLNLVGEFAARVHLPIGAEVMPHPETGLELDAVPSGAVARVPDVRFGEARAVGRELRSVLASLGRSGPLEFHAEDGGFFAGDLILPLESLPLNGPTVVALLGTHDALRAQPASPPARVLTIARMHGTGGEAIAQMVASELGLRYVDREVFGRAAEQAGVSAESVKGAAQHRGVFARVLDGLARAQSPAAEMWVAPTPLQLSPIYTSADYRAFVEGAVRDLADQGDVLIVGHGAQLVLANRPDIFRVLIAGSVDCRAARAVAQGLSPDEARHAIHNADAERVAYFREFYSAGWLDPASYDLIVNTDHTSIDQAAAIIIDAVRIRSRRGDASPSKPPPGAGVT